MFESALDNSPSMFRHITEAKLLARLESGAGTSGTVSKGLLAQVLREVTPRPFVSRALAVIAPLKSEATAKEETGSS